MNRRAAAGFCFKFFSFLDSREAYVMLNLIRRLWSASGKAGWIQAVVRQEVESALPRRTGN